ncbi:MAG: DUF2007 domain-containing protein, partial [Chthoniobacterales bacterium]
MITIRTYFDSMEANVVASFLKDRGIEVSLLDTNSSIIRGSIAIPVRLQVDDAQAEEADKLLKE